MNTSNENKGLNINVKPEDLDDVICDKCKNPTFRQVVMLKKIPASISPNGKVSFLPMPIFECSNCGNINDELVPKIKGEETQGSGLVK